MAGFSDPSALRKLHDALEKAGKRVEVKTYPRMPHAFMNEERPEVYHEAEAKDALERAVAFFDEHLK